jgi:hypothetical protein
MHIEETHVRPHDWQILLNLADDARLGQPAAALRACIGKGNVDAFVNRRGRLAMPCRPCRRPARRPGCRGCAVGAPLETAAPDACRRAAPPRGRVSSARYLAAAIAVAFQTLPLVLQLVTIAPQLLALSLQPRVVLTESFRFLTGLLALTPQALQFTLRVFARVRGRALWHATVMADSRKKYKPKLWIGAVNPLTSYGRPTLAHLP